MPESAKARFTKLYRASRTLRNAEGEHLNLHFLVPAQFSRETVCQIGLPTENQYRQTGFRPRGAGVRPRRAENVQKRA